MWGTSMVADRDRDLQQMVSRGRGIEDSRRTHRVQEVEGACRKI